MGLFCLVCVTKYVWWVRFAFGEFASGVVLDASGRDCEVVLSAFAYLDGVDCDDAGGGFGDGACAS